MSTEVSAAKKARMSKAEKLLKIKRMKAAKFNKRMKATLGRAKNPKTKKNEWALMTQDGSKVLEYFGSTKPTEKEFQKAERRVNHYKHMKSATQDYSGTGFQWGKKKISKKRYPTLHSVLAEFPPMEAANGPAEGCKYYDDGSDSCLDESYIQAAKDHYGAEVRDNSREELIEIGHSIAQGELEAALGTTRVEAGIDQLRAKEDANGNLVISLQYPEKKDELLQEYKESQEDHRAPSWEEGFEYLLANGWDNVAPEEVGALTSAPIIGEVSRDDMGNLIEIESLYWYPQYETKDPLEELYKNGQVVFQSAEAKIESSLLPEAGSPDFEALPADLASLYSDKVQVLDKKRIDDKRGVVFYKTNDMSYFSPSGKARLAAVAKYDVEVHLDGVMGSQEHRLSRYNMTDKVEAKKYFNEIVKKVAGMQPGEEVAASVSLKPTKVWWDKTMAKLQASQPDRGVENIRQAVRTIWYDKFGPKRKEAIRANADSADQRKLDGYRAAMEDPDLDEEDRADLADAMVALQKEMDFKSGHSHKEEGATLASEDTVTAMGPQLSVMKDKNGKLEVIDPAEVTKYKNQGFREVFSGDAEECDQYSALHEEKSAPAPGNDAKIDEALKHLSQSYDNLKDPKFAEKIKKLIKDLA